MIGETSCLNYEKTMKYNIANSQFMSYCGYYLQRVLTLCAMSCALCDLLEDGKMAKVCEICGKGPVFGHNVSHANNKTRKIWYPNFHKVKANKEGRTVSVKVCSRCLRSGKVVKAV